jgi:signal transduction histidine kinase
MTTPAPATPGPTAPAVRWVPRRWARLPRRTVRLRLTLLYGGLFLLSGAGLLLITYVLVAHRLPVAATGSARPGSAAGGTMVYSQAGCPALSGGLPASPGQAQDQIARCLNQQRAAELHQLLTESGLALAIMTMASIGLGWVVAGRALRPLRTITAAAQRISASSLNQRLALAGPDDELKELGNTFDGLLSRLEAAFRAQRQFVANASHELRTPLTRQRTLVEVALADPHPTVASLRGVCRRVLATGEQQDRLIEALLTLARSERGLDQRDPLDLAAVTSAALADRRHEAGDRGIRLEAVLGAARVLGDARLAERLVANLVDNALRHNQAGGTAQVVTAVSAGQAVLSVTNTGPVIPADQIDQLFRPFQRLGGERGVTGDGLGLGLTIATAIAAAHGAILRARPMPAGGLAVQVWFPPLAGRTAAPQQPG